VVTRDRLERVFPSKNLGKNIKLAGWDENGTFFYLSDFPSWLKI
jgi:hypothetical protein